MVVQVAGPLVQHLLGGNHTRGQDFQGTDYYFTEGETVEYVTYVAKVIPWWK